MSELLTSRFESEFDPYSVQEFDLNLTYSDRQRIKVGEYAAVAQRMLPVLNRRISWLKVSVLLGTIVLGAGFVISASIALDFVTTSKTVVDVSYPLLYAFCLGTAAVVASWRAVSLEKKRVLCELVIAEQEESDPKSTVGS